MRAATDSRGYTIVEVMIFLAISGVMFVMAAGFVSGKQSKAEFKNGTTNSNAKIRQVINDVSNGFFPSSGNFTCSAPNAGGDLSISDGTKTQGTNGGEINPAQTGCVFLGKVLQVGNDTDGNAGYRVYSVAGRQWATYDSSKHRGQPTTGFDDAKPQVVPQITEDNIFTGGLQATKICLVNGASQTPISAVGFFSTFAAGASDGGLQSGGQGVSVVPLGNGLAAVGSRDSAVEANIRGLNNYDAGLYTNPQINIYFDGGNGEFATLTIGGGDGQRLTTKIQISNTQPTGC